MNDPLFSIPLLILSSYLIGSFPTAYLYCRLRGKDIRKEGSGNVGATNAARLFGKSAFIIVFGIDALKGYVSVRYLVPLFVHSNVPADWLLLLVLLFAVIGHVWTVFLGFKGGKGVAVSAGGLVALMPFSVLFSLIVFGLVFIFSRIVSLGSVCAALALPLIAWTTKEPGLYTAFSVILSAFILFTHRSNLHRLFAGTEKKVGRTGQ
ncbi:MAG: glycerol-3-phosphate 1-O-acyltransferase PlsY [Candidatus Aureabacteria bacterium]|nr:glycerol-3-phosphate 1-O-acyltransferase PlsY [Candidatus Auribacterota bacterium]